MPACPAGLLCFVSRRAGAAASRNTSTAPTFWQAYLRSQSWHHGKNMGWHDLYDFQPLKLKGFVVHMLAWHGIATNNYFDRSIGTSPCWHVHCKVVSLPFPRSKNGTTYLTRECDVTSMFFTSLHVLFPLLLLSYFLPLIKQKNGHNNRRLDTTSRPLLQITLATWPVKLEHEWLG